MPIKEEWRPVPGYPFEASSEGRIREAVGKRVRPTTPNGEGYVMVSNGRHHKPTAHMLVALAFHGPCPSGLEVRHLNDVKLDNRPSNLAYGTRSQNVADSVRNGTHWQTAKTHCKRGHEFTPPNTGSQRNGQGRFCRACVKEQHRDSERRRRERNRLNQEG